MHALSTSDPLQIVRLNYDGVALMAIVAAKRWRCHIVFVLDKSRLKWHLAESPMEERLLSLIVIHHQHAAT
jgi:hypothetical protein